MYFRFVTMHASTDRRTDKLTEGDSQSRASITCSRLVVDVVSRSETDVYRTATTRVLDAPKSYAYF